MEVNGKSIFFRSNELEKVIKKIIKVIRLRIMVDDRNSMKNSLQILKDSLAVCFLTPQTMLAEGCRLYSVKHEAAE